MKRLGLNWQNLQHSAFSNKMTLSHRIQVGLQSRLVAGIFRAGLPGIIEWPLGGNFQFIVLHCGVIDLLYQGIVSTLRDQPSHVGTL